MCCCLPGLSLQNHRHFEWQEGSSGRFCRFPRQEALDWGSLPSVRIKQLQKCFFRHMFAFLGKKSERMGVCFHRLLNPELFAARPHVLANNLPTFCDADLFQFNPLTPHLPAEPPHTQTHTLHSRHT